MHRMTAKMSVDEILDLTADITAQKVQCGPSAVPVALYT